MDWTAIIAAALALLGSVVIQRLREKSSARKQEAETRKLEAETDVILADAWKGQAKELQGQLTATQADLSALRTDYFDFKAKTEEAIRKLRGFGLRMWAGIKKLTEQIVGLDETPAWEPHEDIREHYEGDSLQ